jgi:hypothetical protein
VILLGVEGAGTRLLRMTDGMQEVIKDGKTWGGGCAAVVEMPMEHLSS